MEVFYSYERLKMFSERIFQKIGFSEVNAKIAARTLLSADLRGVDSHGIARLTGYVRLWETGRINSSADPSVIHELPSTAVVDGKGGLGLIIAPFAMQIAINKALQTG